MSITFVGSWAAAQGNNVTSLTLTGRTSTAGNFLAAGATASATTNFTSISDSLSNTWTQAAPASGWQHVGGDSIRIYSASSITGGASHTVKLQFSAAAFCCLSVSEYSFGGAAALDQRAAAGATGSSNSLNSGATPTTTAADELVVGYGTLDANNAFTWVAGTNFILRGNLTDAANGTTGALEDRVVASAGAYAATLTVTGTPSPFGWDMLAATFKPAAAGGGATAYPAILIPFAGC